MHTKHPSIWRFAISLIAVIAAIAVSWYFAEVVFPSDRPGVHYHLATLLNVVILWKTRKMTVEQVVVRTVITVLAAVLAVLVVVGNFTDRPFYPLAGCYILAHLVWLNHQKKVQ